jgi:leader peptidase (prepilin peptidase)/N-methyltransferase
MGGRQRWRPPFLMPMLFAFSILLGLCLGSFANVCIFRLPEEQSIVFPFSRCPRCLTTLGFWENIPVVSYLGLRGHCRHCHKPISPQYPLVEASLAFLFVLSAWKFRHTGSYILFFDVLIFYLLTISVIDAYHKIIPDELSLSLLGFGWLTSLWNPYLDGYPWPGWAISLIAGVTGGAVMLAFAWGGEKLFKKEALGGGDVKLMAAFGAFLGWKGLLGALTIGSFVGALWGGGLLLAKRKRPGDAIPYGPFLCLGAFVYGFFPDWAVHFLSP